MYEGTNGSQLVHIRQLFSRVAVATRVAKSTSTPNRLASSRSVETLHRTNRDESD